MTFTVTYRDKTGAKHEEALERVTLPIAIKHATCNVEPNML